MRTTGKKFSIQPGSNLGMPVEREIELLGGLIGQLRHQEAIKFNQAKGSDEFTLVARNGDKWMVSFRPHEGDDSRRRYYDTPTMAARIVYCGYHF